MGTTTTTLTAILTAVIVVRRVWEVLSRRITANSASALIPIPKRRKRLHVVKRSIRAMATVMMTTTTLTVISTAVTVARRVWAVPSRRITVKNANALIPTPKLPKPRHVVTRSTRAMATATTTTMRVVHST